MMTRQDRFSFAILERPGRGPVVAHSLVPPCTLESLHARAATEGPAPEKIYSGRGPVRSAPFLKGNRGLAVIVACLLVSLLSACERREPPGALDGRARTLSINSTGSGSTPVFDRDSYQEEEQEGGPLRGAEAQFGTVDDNLPFAPTGDKVASIAWRTWIYTDTGPKRTRLGYLRAGAVLDARLPLIVNAGCKGGWLRVNPRGFVCLGKGATQDLEHPVVQQSSQRPIRGETFPYRYALSRDRAPERYFRLPTRKQLVDIEGPKAISRGANFRARALSSGLAERWEMTDELPTFLEAPNSIIEKPYGVETHLRRQVHAGRASVESGFALLDSFFWDGRGYALSTEMDILPLDRLKLVQESSLRGLELSVEQGLPVVFHVRGSITLWAQGKSGGFSPQSAQREKRGFRLSGEKATGGMIETEDGQWLVQSSVRGIEPRESFPSVATGRRKWIDISFKKQTLVAYEGMQPVYATLISGGRGGLGKKGEGNPDESRTVRGTFMIHEKSISSTMDGDEDRSDNFELQDVPFVQYFHRGFALHGAYWHDDFGRQRSHGCINLAPRDSAWLFEWSDPQVPPGWHAALNKERGTVVYIHN